MDRPPRVGLRMFLKAMTGVLVIFVATGAGVAGAGYFQIPDLESDPPGPGPAAPTIPEIPEEDVPPPEPGQPRTIMVLGSDRRAKTSTDARIYGQNEKPALGHDRPASAWTPSATGSRCSRCRATSR